MSMEHFYFIPTNDVPIHCFMLKLSFITRTDLLKLTLWSIHSSTTLKTRNRLLQIILLYFFDNRVCVHCMFPPQVKLRNVLNILLLGLGCNSTLRKSSAKISLTCPKPKDLSRSTTCTDRLTTLNRMIDKINATPVRTRQP